MISERKLMIVHDPDPDDGHNWMSEPTPVDLLAAVRRGVESGTIKGEVVRLCRVHLSAEHYRYDGELSGVCVIRATDNHHKPGPCYFAECAVIPVPDGGSET